MALTTTGPRASKDRFQDGECIKLDRPDLRVDDYCVVVGTCLSYRGKEQDPMFRYVLATPNRNMSDFPTIISYQKGYEKFLLGVLDKPKTFQHCVEDLGTTFSGFLGPTRLLEFYMHETDDWTLWISPEIYVMSWTNPKVSYRKTQDFVRAHLYPKTPQIYTRSELVTIRGCMAKQVLGTKDGPVPPHIEHFRIEDEAKIAAEKYNSKPLYDLGVITKKEPTIERVIVWGGNYEVDGEPHARC